MYKRTKHKRRQVKVRRFFELTLLPIMVSMVILFLLFVGLVGPLGVRFSSLIQMVLLVSLGIIVIGGLVFETSRTIIKRLMHDSTMNFMERIIKKLFKKGYWLAFP